MPAAYPPTVFVYGPRSNSSAVASLVFGIMSWFLCPLLGGGLAVILGHVAHSQIRRSGEGGGGMATAGLILGYINVAASLLVALFWIVVVGGLSAAVRALPTPTP
jgi:glycerol-3-phosphate acyltransferase PlsY